MFLQKLSKLATDWGKQPSDMEAIARESLLYGMRIQRTPGRLKMALKQQKIDSKLATPMWSGNAYLLLTLPKVLVDKKRKIPCLEDYLYARTILKKQDMKDFRRKVKALPDMERDEILKRMLPQIRRRSRAARFIPMFDPATEMRDIEHDLIAEMLKVINKEMTNLRSKDIKSIETYFGYCFDSKLDTYLKSNTPDARRAYTEDEQALDRLLESARQNEVEQYELTDRMTIDDLKELLTWEQFEAVGLLLSVPGTESSGEFNQYLAKQSLDPETLSTGKLKYHIQRFLQAPEVFQELKEHPELQEYLRGQ